MPLTTRVEELGACSIVAVSGELDLATAGQLWAALAAELARRDAPLVLDLAELSFCDSAGLAVFVKAHTTLEERGRRLVLARPAPMVARVLELSGVDQAILAAADLDEARALVADS
jgi:anti-sigma B factor antagonist